MYYYLEYNKPLKHTSFHSFHLIYIQTLSLSSFHFGLPLFSPHLSFHHYYFFLSRGTRVHLHGCEKYKFQTKWEELIEIQTIVKILNLWIIILCTHLYHFFLASIHYLQCIHCLNEWVNEWMKIFILLSFATFMNENRGHENVKKCMKWNVVYCKNVK